VLSTSGAKGPICQLLFGQVERGTPWQRNLPHLQLYGYFAAIPCTPDLRDENATPRFGFKDVLQGSVCHGKR
jgi:hypothetical protein